MFVGWPHSRHTGLQLTTLQKYLRYTCMSKDNTAIQWLKIHKPVEYTLLLLQTNQQNDDLMLMIINEVKYRNLEIWDDADCRGHFEGNNERNEGSYREMRNAYRKEVTDDYSSQLSLTNMD